MVTTDPTSAEPHGGMPMELPPIATRAMPPIAPLAVASMACVIAGGIYLAAYIPRHAPLGPAIGLLLGAGGLFAAGASLTARLRDFAWHVFKQVSGYALLAYMVIAGMLEFTFVYDKTSGSQLLVLSAMLVIFAVDIPLLLGYSVARYQEPRAGA